MALSGLVGGCKTEPSPDTQAKADKRAAQLAEEARAAVAARPDGLRDFQQAMQAQLQPGLEPVPIAKLQALLPKAIEGMQTVAAVDAAPRPGALNISTASAHFRSPKATLALQIADMGPLKAFSDFANIDWAQAKIDRETAEGHERTLTFEGFRGFEESERRSGAQSLKLLVKERFIVQAQSEGLSSAQLKAAARQIDLSGLAKLAAPGPRPPGAK